VSAVPGIKQTAGTDCAEDVPDRTNQRVGTASSLPISHHRQRLRSAMLSARNNSTARTDSPRCGIFQRSLSLLFQKRRFSLNFSSRSHTSAQLHDSMVHGMKLPRPFVRSWLLRRVAESGVLSMKSPVHLTSCWLPTSQRGASPSTCRAANRRRMISSSEWKIRIRIQSVQFGDPSQRVRTAQRPSSRHQGPYSGLPSKFSK